MCGEHQAPAVLSAWKQTPYPMNRQISGPPHKTSYWLTGIALLELSHIGTLLDHMDCVDGITEVKYSLTVVKEMDWLSPTHGSRSQKEDCTHGRHLEIGVDISWTASL